MSSKRCCVPRCVESQGLHKILHLFPNPKNEIQRFRTWIYAIGGDILGLSNEYIYKHRRVCHAHFEEKYCCRNSRISNIAVPTLLMPGSLSQPIFTFTETRPLREIQNLPSTSKDTVAVVHDVSSKVPEHTLEVNTTMDLFHDPTEKTINNSTAVVPNESSKVPEHTLEVNSTMDLVHDTTEKTINDSVTVEMVPDVSNKVPEHTLEVDSTKTTVNRRALKKSRIIASKKVFTASEHKLYQKIVKMRSQLSKSRSKVKKQSASLKAAKKLTSNPAFIAAIDKLPNTAKILTMLQLREVRKKDKGRRFSLKEKITALSILKQSPKCYRFLRKIFILPAPQTLTKLINQANVKPGINKKIFLQIKEATASLKVGDRLCVLLFDEMSLKANITYNERMDRVIGFVTDGQTTKPEISSVHAPGANCERDYCNVLYNLILADDCQATETSNLESIPDVQIINISEKNDPRVMGALQFVSGYFVNKARQNVFKNCKECLKNTVASQENEYIKRREYAGRRWLVSPSESLLSCISDVQDINNDILKKNLYKNNLKELIKTIVLIYVDFNFLNCENHKDKLINYMINLSCRFFIYNYCKDINKILKGRRDCNDDEDNFQLKAKKYYHKCFKRRNK